MGVTRFPDGINVGSEAGVAGAFQIGGTAYNPVSASTAGVKVGGLAGTVITGGGTIAPSALGLTTVTSATASFAGTAISFGGTAVGQPFFLKCYVTGGSVAIRLFDTAGTEATAAGTVGINARGT